jgi:hypothetical protein
MIVLNLVFKTNMVLHDLVMLFSALFNVPVKLSFELVYLIHWIADKKSKPSDDISSNDTNNRRIYRSRGQTSSVRCVSAFVVCITHAGILTILYGCKGKFLSTAKILSSGEM